MRRGELYTAGGDVCGVDPIAGHVVGQAGILETRVKLYLKDLGYILRVGIALDADGKVTRNRNAVNAAAHKRCGKRDILIELAGDDGGPVWGIIGTAQRRADLYDGVVRGDPGHRAPCIESRGSVAVVGSLAFFEWVAGKLQSAGHFRGEREPAGHGIQSFSDLLFIPRYVGVYALLDALTVHGQHYIDVHIAAVAGHAAVEIIAYRAVGSDGAGLIVVLHRFFQRKLDFALTDQ